MMEVIGKKIVDVIKLPNVISGKEGWEPYDGIALVLNDGSFLYPSRDEEGNGPGTLFGF